MEGENTTVEGGGEITVTDRELFDNAIEPSSPAPSPAAPAEPSSAPAGQQAAPTPPSPAPTTGQPRDEQGRFAPRQEQQPPAPPQQQAPQAPTAPSAPPPQDHRVPLRELLDERERRQRIEAEANQMRQAWQQFQAMQQQQAMAAQQGQLPQTIFDNPDQYLIQNVINPIREEGRMEFMRMKDELSREMAEQQFGEQRVTAALNELAKIRQTPNGDFQFRQIMSARHPYGALVRWHDQHRAHSVIGNDPNAWLRKQQEQWLNDPKVRAEVVKRIQAEQGASNRPPTVNLPPSLSSLPGGSGTNDAGDLSDASLYRFATS